jgi:hypothetical protein
LVVCLVAARLRLERMPLHLPLKLLRGRPVLPAPLMLLRVQELVWLGELLVRLMPLDLAASAVLRPDLALLEPELVAPQVLARLVYPTLPAQAQDYSAAPLAWRARPLPGEQPVVFQACLGEERPLLERLPISWVPRHHQPSAQEP